MSAPKFRMLSSTDPDDTSCTAWFTVNGEEHELAFTTNMQAHKVSDLIQAAYTSGWKDGQRTLAREVYRDLEGHL